MVEQNISQEFTLQNTEETKNCLTEKINQIKFMNKKHKEVRTVFSYIEHLLILASVVTGCVSISLL